jgi:hypothetical protein
MARPKPTSAANGRLSHGPATQAGKDRSRSNAVAHGRTAGRFRLLKHVSREDFYNLATGLGCTFTPGNTAEKLVVESIITDEWRLRRTRSMATVLMQDAVTGADPDASPVKVICELAETRAFNVLNRYEATLQNALARSTRSLAFIRKSFPNAVASLPSEDLELETSAPEEVEAPVAAPAARTPVTTALVRTPHAFASAPATAHPDERNHPHLGTHHAKAAG